MWHEAQPIALNVSAPALAACRQSSGRSALTVGGGKRRLERDQSRDVAGGDRVGHAALGEVVAAGPADAEPLDRLHAVVDVERVDGELPAAT